MPFITPLEPELLLQMKNNITVFTDNSLYGQVAQLHAQKLAQIFDAEIHYVEVLKTNDFRNVSIEVGERLFFILPIVSPKCHQLFNLKKVKKWIRRARVPVFITGISKPNIDDYQQIVLPIDLNCQEKELALWASYFPAYFQKNCPQIPKENVLIHIIYNQYNNDFLSKKVLNNIEYVMKLLDNLKVHYKLHSFKKVNNIHTFGLQFAKNIENSILLHLIPAHNSLIDMFFGPIVTKLLNKKEHIPVLCLNAREDILMLCR